MDFVLLAMILILVSVPFLIFSIAAYELGWNFFSTAQRTDERLLSKQFREEKQVEHGKDYNNNQSQVMVEYFERAFEKITELDKKYTILFDRDIQQSIVITENIELYRQSAMEIIQHQKNAIQASDLTDSEKLLLLMEGQTELLRVWAFLVSALVSSGRSHSIK